MLKWVIFWFVILVVTIILLNRKPKGGRNYSVGDGND